VQLTRVVPTPAACVRSRRKWAGASLPAIERVVEELRSLKHENVYLADDTLFFPIGKSTITPAPSSAVEPLGKKYFVSSTMALKHRSGFSRLATGPACGISTAR